MSHHKALVQAAKADARIFADEFPGDTLGRSDWDSEAFAQLTGLAADATEALGDRAWEIYSEALRREVALLSVSDDDIRRLRERAAAAGDDAQVHACFVALGAREPGYGGQRWPESRAAALSECARVIIDGRSQEDGEQ